MEPFEYISVLTSLILGLGITQLLTGVANMILVGKKIKLFIPHTLWIILLFGFHIQEWWNNYMHETEIHEWRLLDFFFLILYPIVLFILARMLFPSFKRKKVIDLRKFYFNHYTRIFFVGALLPLISIPQNYFMSGIPISEQWVQMTLALLFIVPVVMKLKNVYYHYGFAIIGILAGLLYLVYFDPQL